MVCLSIPSVTPFSQSTECKPENVISINAPVVYTNFFFSLIGTDLEAALDNLLEQIEVEEVEAFDDNGEFEIATIFLD